LYGTASYISLILFLQKFASDAQAACGKPKNFNQEPNLIVRNVHFLYDIISNSLPYLQGHEIGLPPSKPDDKNMMTYLAKLKRIAKFKVY